ncbi:hypothetical protein [Streptomyces sp. 8N616]|uniref:hypothetical protein n=1 Tax=Streptomyces sp. 8N616 TaxID=3457414 RepID=UPI003FD21A5D
MAPMHDGRATPDGGGNIQAQEGLNKFDWGPWQGVLANPPHRHEPAKGPKWDGKSGSVKGTKGGSGEYRVDSRSMKEFAHAVRGLITELVDPAHEMLKTVQVEPGGFGHAEDIRSLVNGEQVKKRYMDALDDLGQGFEALAQGLEKLADKYSSTEDQNKMSADELGEVLSDFGSYKPGSGKA